MVTERAEDRVLSDLLWIRERVVNVVGHELRTPASTVRGLADALAAAPDPAHAADLVAAIQRHATRLEGLVDDLLAASGVTSSLPVGAPVPLELGPAVTEAWRAAGGAPAGLIADYGPTRVSARPRSVRRILDHVLANAVTFGSGDTTVATRPEGPHVLLTVDSPGPELPREDVRFATELFWRGERAVTTVPGLGLGLAVARALAEHEEGALDVDALDGGGLRTVVALRAA